jgi:hypothetical protein
MPPLQTLLDTFGGSNELRQLLTEFEANSN